MTLRILLILGLVIPTASVLAQPKAKKPTDAPITIPEFTPVFAPASVFVAIDDRLPRTKLKKAVYVPNLCSYRYHVSTRSAECQKFIDQSLGYYYSYVWIEAARSAETALLHDPDCAFAWLALHKGMEKWGQGDNLAALKKAQELMPKASHREQLLITAKLTEKNLLGKATPDEAKKRAAKSLDELLTIYDDDEEGWFARASLSGLFGGAIEGVPYYKALLRVNPLHPGANHELVHYFEGFQRPALGWPNAEAYVASSPGIPHAFHMQSHLAMRIGKWELTTDRSAKAIELQREYHRIQGVKPSQDHQYSHHLETLTLSLVHDARYREVGEIRKICESHGYRFNTMPWFRALLGQGDWTGTETMIAEQKKTDKGTGSYMAALMSLQRNDIARANAEVDVLRQIQQTKRNDKRLENRLLEVQGRTLCASGSGAEGIKLLQRVVDRTKGDYSHHAWGAGAYYMEAWGIGALEAGDAIVAEEAFLEALAHDAGSAVAAFGMEALCQRVGRTAEANSFAKVANRLWAKADPKDLSEMRATMARRAEHISLGANLGRNRHPLIGVSA